MNRPTMDDARATLRSSFGYGEFRPGQETAIESVLSGRDTLVVLPTGGGKSVCFQIPALVLPGITVVVSPLISLMKDQVDALTARGLPAAFINSTLTSSQVSDRLARAATGDIKLLYLAPERFDFGNTASRLQQIGVSLLAVDEAHCISEWGHDFRPSYLKLAEARTKLGSPPTVALTATATPEVRRDICRQLVLRNPRTIITGFDRTNLTYHVLPARNDAEKDSLLVGRLRGEDGLAVVYAATRKSVDRIGLMLEREGIPAAAYHAGLDDEHRRRVQDDFMSERIRAIIATNAFGMGIDKPNVRMVIHHSMPGSLEAYYQEAGRAGRDGKKSSVYLIHSFPDRFTHEFFIRGSYPEKPLVERVYDALRRQAAAGRQVPESPEQIASLAGGKANPREVESALRILARAGAIGGVEGVGSTVLVRLLATPQRIRREIAGDANPELGLLRALWRVAGDALSTGASIALDGLPPGLAGRSTATALLDALQSRQILVWEPMNSGLRLSDAAAPLTAFKVDWSGLDRRRAAELSKVNAVQRYAYSKGCRRGFVLRYFGDPAARVRCDGCDNCLGIAVRHETVSGAAPARQASRPRHGREAKLRKSRVMAVTEDGYPAPGPADERLLAALKARRSELARHGKVPAYVVFSDRTLAEMAMQRPGSLEALRAVRGVGDMKLSRYGEDFLTVIRSNQDTEAP